MENVSVCQVHVERFGLCGIVLNHVQNIPSWQQLFKFHEQQMETEFNFDHNTF